MKKFLVAGTLAILLTLNVQAAPSTTQFNLQTFGPSNGNPKLNGTGDWRNAMQDAINNAGTNGTIYIPPGDYRFVVGMPIRGFVSRIYGEGRIWISMPANYTNPNTYGVTNKYVATGVLDRNGVKVTWDSSSAENPNQSYYGNYPWNGKTAIFQDIGHPSQCVIEGLSFDGGWGTTGAPGAVLPVTGIRRFDNENTLYAFFANCSNIKFSKCQFQNIPGALTTDCFGTMVMENCTFGEYGDHLFYHNDRSGFRFSGNNTILNRVDVGIEGAANFVAQTYRDSIKFRDMRNCVVSGNVHLDLNPTRQSQFMTIESSASAGGHVYTYGTSNIVVSGNTVRSAIGIIGASFRSRGDGTGLRIQDVSITGNNWNTTLNVLQFIDVACDRINFSANDCYLNEGVLAQVFGSLLYEHGVTDLNFHNNPSITGASFTRPVIELGGNIDSVSVVNNSFLCTDPQSGFRMEIVNTTSQASPDKDRTYRKLGYLTFENNRMQNYQALLLDDGLQFWDATTTYTYTSTVEDDGTFIDNKTVLDTVNSLAYTNKATVISATRPGLDAANWGVYIPDDTTVIMVDNKRFSDSAVTSPLGASYLAQIDATSLKHNYRVVHNGNIHRTSLGQPIDYLFPSSTSPSSVIQIYTNLYGNLNTLSVRNKSRFGSTNSPLATVHVQQGGLRADGGTAVGIYTPLTLGISPTINTDFNANRESRFTTISDGNSFTSYLFYNGYPSNTLASTTYYQGSFGKMSAIQFDALGGMFFLVSTNDFGGGANTLVTPPRALSIQPSIVAGDPVEVGINGNVTISGNASITGGVTTPSYTTVNLFTQFLTSTNGLTILQGTTAPTAVALGAGAGRLWASNSVPPTVYWTSTANGVSATTYKVAGP